MRTLFFASGVRRLVTGELGYGFDVSNLFRYGYEAFRAIQEKCLVKRLDPASDDSGSLLSCRIQDYATSLLIVKEGRRHASHR